MAIKKRLDQLPYIYPAKRNTLKKNIGIEDRIVRFVVMDFLLGASFLGIELDPFWTNASFILSIILVITIIIGYSPIYHLLGISTKYVKPEEETNENHPE